LGASDVIANRSVDFVLLDIMLQDADGFDSCKEIRERTDMPVLFVSAKSEEADKIEGLDVVVEWLVAVTLPVLTAQPLSTPEPPNDYDA